MTDTERRALVAAMAAHERAREAWNVRGRTTWEGAVDVGISQRDINAAAEDLRASRSWN